MPLFAVEPLTIMISSRCSDPVSLDGKQQRMSDLRAAMKKELESICFGDHPVFRVWIHEPESVISGEESSWDHCMSQARKADIVLVLYNGNAGSSGSSQVAGDYVGICHAEFQEAFERCPSKVRSVQFAPIKAIPGSPDERFQNYFKNQGVSGAQVETGEQAIEAAKKAAVAALLDLARAGVGINSKGKYYAGQALAWTRLDFQARREVTIRTVIDFLAKRYRTTELTDVKNIVILPLNNQKVAFVCDCIPSSMSTAAARELVGQPFLRDHLIVSNLRRRIGGPVHLIACQKSVTESQAIRQLGFPDAVVVSAPFGIYVADDVQKIQMVFIANCRDETTTQAHVQRFLQWLDEQSEVKLLAMRANSRRKIADLISKEHSAA